MAEITNYGSVVHHSDAPSVLFFVSEIGTSDSFEVRKALRNHDIKTLVLASPGGSVWEALNIAGIIFDRKIDVIVPSDTKCASACAYLFFAGNQRLVNGELGVHQFSSVELNAADDTEAITQFTTSEIIGFLNEFETPPFVFERMFQQQDMYWFNEEELLQLQTERNPSFEQEVEVAEDTLKLWRQEIARRVDDANAQIVSRYFRLSRREKVQTFQQALNLRSCPVGLADGIMGHQTRYGLQQAAAAGEFTYSEYLINDEAFVRFVLIGDSALCTYRDAQTRIYNPVVPPKAANPVSPPRAGNSDNGPLCALNWCQ